MVLKNDEFVLSVLRWWKCFVYFVCFVVLEINMEFIIKSVLIIWIVLEYVIYLYIYLLINKMIFIFLIIIILLRGGWLKNWIKLKVES